MEQNTTIERLHGDPAAYTLVKYLSDHEEALGLATSHVYYDFPLYKEEETVVSTPVLLVSATHGIVAFGVSNATGPDNEADLLRADRQLDQAFGHLYSRLIKNRALRSGKKSLSFNLEAAIFAPEVDTSTQALTLDAPLLCNVTALRDFLEDLSGPTLPSDIVAEAVATVEGAKGLIRPKERALEGRSPDSKVAQVAALEAEIRRFDRDQKHGYLAVLDGPQRIRGLAGSGKTVVLAMKAALTHLRDPEAKIAFTFYTKSLYQHVQRLITRFYRQFDDRDPNWNHLIILHAWGGRTNPGIYYNACVANNVPALSYAHAASQSNLPAFDFACRELLVSTDIQPSYDYVFVDEGQDFQSSFLQLCLRLARENRLVWAYDDLQTIFQAQAPTPDEIFGKDKHGQALATLDEDVVLHKCYRNPLEILVCAHALGFGIYGNHIVQMLENEEHWEDLGYLLEEGELKPGKTVKIKRPKENSPSSVSEYNTIGDIVSAKVFENSDSEIEYVANRIEHDIKIDGLNPDDIIVVVADDRHLKLYLGHLTSCLKKKSIGVNNLQLDTYGIRDFTEEGRVTMCTIHKAKGNEGYIVYIMGVDALFNRPSIRERNRIFTAMTRAKAWLHVSGIGRGAEAFVEELKKAKKACPRLIFKYPTEKDIKLMKRDLEESAVDRARRLLDELQEQLSFDEFKEVLRERLDTGNDTPGRLRTRRPYKKIPKKGKKL